MSRGGLPAVRKCASRSSTVIFLQGYVSTLWKEDDSQLYILVKRIIFQALPNGCLYSVGNLFSAGVWEAHVEYGPGRPSSEQQYKLHVKGRAHFLLCFVLFKAFCAASCTLSGSSSQRPTMTRRIPCLSRISLVMTMIVMRRSLYDLRSSRHTLV